MERGQGLGSDVILIPVSTSLPFLNFMIVTGCGPLQGQPITRPALDIGLSFVIAMALI